MTEINFKISNEEAVKIKSKLKKYFKISRKDITLDELLFFAASSLVDFQISSEYKILSLKDCLMGIEVEEDKNLFLLRKGEKFKKWNKK